MIQLRWKESGAAKSFRPLHPFVIDQEHSFECLYLRLSEIDSAQSPSLSLTRPVR